MPKLNEIEKQIPELYRANALSLSLFAYVRGARSALHTITVSQAVDMFMAEYGLTDDTYNKESAVTTYNRMQNKFINLLKHSDNG